VTPTYEKGHIYSEWPKLLLLLKIIKNEKILVTLHVKNVTGALNIVIRNVTDGPKYGVECG